MPTAPEWLVKSGECDVHLEGTERRVVLYPLFLCPKIVTITAGQIGVNAIVNLVAAAKGQLLPPDEALGRQAVDNVLSGRPTQLSKVTGVANIVNMLIERRGLAGGVISTGNIVSCVFRVRGFSAMVRTLGLTEKDIAQRAGVEEAFVHSLSRNFRLHLKPVLRVVDVLRQEIEAHPADNHADLQKRFMGPLNGIVVADDAQRTNVEKIGTDDKDKDLYLLNERNVEAAPRSGHPWALDR